MSHVTMQPKYGESKIWALNINREFKQITTDGATTAAVTEKVWGDYVSVVC